MSEENHGNNQGLTVLYKKLSEAEASVANGTDLLNADDVFSLLRMKFVNTLSTQNSG